MKVDLLTADHEGCGFYRCFEPARVLADEPGLEVAVNELMLRPDRSDATGRRIRPPDTDVVVIARPIVSYRANLVAELQRHGVAVVVEIDDLVHALEPAHVHYEPMLADPDRLGAQWLERAVADADLVTTTTPALADAYGPWGHAVVVPNFVPARYLDAGRARVRAEGRPQRIGWPGYTGTHPGDLWEAAMGVERAMAATGAAFAHLGGNATDGRTVAMIVGAIRGGLPDPDRFIHRDAVPIDAYHDALGALIDVGIVPLRDTPFTRGKSAIKALELAAAGIPVVASPTPDNRRLAAQGAGRLAHDEGDWAFHLIELAGSPAAWADAHGRGLEAAAANTYERHGHLWAEAWAEALRRRRARP